MKNSTPFTIWFDFIKQYWPGYALGVMTVVLTDIMQVLGTLSLGWVLDYFTGDPLPDFIQVFEGQQMFWALFWLLLATRVFLALGRVGWRLTLARKTHVAASMLRRRIWQQVRFFKRQDLSEKWTKGVLMNASNSDVNSSRFLFGFTLVAVIDVVFLGVFTVWAMLSINVELTLWALGVLFFLPIIIKRLSDKEMDRYRSAQEALSSFNDLSSQVVSTIRLQRLTQTGSFWERRLLQNAEDYRQIRLKAVFTSLLFVPAMGLGSVLSYVVLFVLGIPFVLNGSMTIGDFVAMQGLIFLLQNPLMELGYIISDGKKGQTSLERLSEVYQEEADPLLFAGHRLIDDEVRSNDIVLEGIDLNYSFDEHPLPLFDSLGFKLKKGERLGILGPIGSGKSIFIELISGMRQPTHGQVLLYGKPILSFKRDDLCQEVCIVPQKAFLFADTIRANLKLDLEVDDETCWHYLEMAGLKEDVKTFPQGLNTPLGEWGINLSGGQKQRLTLARALMRKPRILLLDDCLSAVDTVTEEFILKNLNTELKETTIVWVAHRASTLKYCHQLIEFNKAESSQDSDLTQSGDLIDEVMI
jgi:ATP-binding cassette, subfamily B, multidrug efflux pump